MSFQSWWGQKSRRAKAITFFATLLTVQIGLCFGTPVGVSWFDQLFSAHLGRDSYGGLGYMIFEAVLAVIVFLVLVGVLIFYRGPAQTPGDKAD